MRKPSLFVCISYTIRNESSRDKPSIPDLVLAEMRVDVDGACAISISVNSL